jgi:acetylornithine/N-succinyldiaminopimelate aminotransferase
MPTTSHVMPTYARVELAFERGEGAWLYTASGERYLDFTSGVAVNALGHAHPKLVGALTEQAQKLWHVSNLYRIPGAERLAERLCAASFAEVAFFCNSGTEAIEGSIKLTRKYHAVSGHPERFRIITFEGAFHGRTLAALSATGNKKYLEGFGPPADGFDQVLYADLEAVKKAITPETAGIMIEPVMGEGGVRVVPHDFLRALRKLCDDRGLLLIFDEVQSGIGRTGKLFAHEHAGVTPDVMALAKALGGGFPVGAFLATAEAAKGMTAGTHGSTFGGNPLAMAVANAIMDVINDKDFLHEVQMKAARLKQKLAEVKDRHAAVISEVRGEGLLIGLKLVPPASAMVDELRAEKMLCPTAGDNVVRLLPPLIIGDEEMNEAVARIDRACARLAQMHKAPGS